MNILLIRPYNIGNINIRLPESLNRRQGVLPLLGISYIASILAETGHEVKILDAIALNLTTNEIRQYIHYLVPDAEKWVRKAYRSFYFRPNYILKRLFKVRGWHHFKKYFDAAKGILCFKMKGNFN